MRMAHLTEFAILFCIQNGRQINLSDRPDPPILQTLIPPTRLQ